MAQDDVRRALRAMDEDDVIRMRLAEGDFAAIDGMTLTPEEQVLVQDAANDLPEVAGFAANFLFEIEGESSHKDHKGEIEIIQPALGLQGIKWQNAVKYAWK